MDLAAALALVLVLEGLGLAIFARSLPQMLAEIDQIGGDGLRKIGLICIGLGAGAYLLIRGFPG